MKRVLVTGSREWSDVGTIRGALALVQAFIPPWDLTLVHGAARGADLIAADEARRLGWEEIEDHPVNWYPNGRFDRSAGHQRNALMVNLGADLCLAFIKDGSGGATGCADRAQRAGITTVRFTR